MKSTVEQLSATRVRINVEVPFEELKPDFDAVYRQLAQQVRVPGFRPGKAPAKIIETRVGRGAVIEQVLQNAVPGRYTDAVTANDVKAISQPQIEVTNIEDGDHVEFTAEVDVRPEIDLPDFSAITVEVDPIAVTDEALDEQLHALQARFGTLTGVDRPVQNGDFVSIDLSATVDGEPVPEATAEGLSHEVGSGQLIEGLDEAVVGVEAEGSTEFTTKLLAGEHAGDEAVVTVTVHSVKERELPEADDEFAQMASEFDTLEELRADLVEKVAQQARAGLAGEIRDKVLEALLEATDIPTPEKVVESEAHAQMHQLIDQFGGDASVLDQALAAEGTDRETFEAETREGAARAIRSQLLLDAVAEEASTEVSQDELMQHIMFQAQRYGMDPNQFIQQIQGAGQLGSLFADVRRSKALADVIEKVSVKDTEGNAVDTSEFFGTGEDTEADEADVQDAEAQETAADADDEKVGED